MDTHATHVMMRAENTGRTIEGVTPEDATAELDRIQSPRLARPGDAVTLREEAARYYRLVERARAAGIPTSLDHPDTPPTVAALAAAVAAAERTQ